MRFLKRNKKADQTVIVISDLHLSAGLSIDGKRNVLEDFHSDQELVSFFEFYSSGHYLHSNVEIVINGDFLDLLAVPYVDFFDDEYWSEKASLEKLRIILDAHTEVIEALDNFLTKKNKKITYIIGNHDGEMVFDSLKELLLSKLSEEAQEKIEIKNETLLYNPIESVYIEHGHNYEVAHSFDQMNAIETASNGKKYFIPSWGAYYVTQIINRYKQERDHVNAVRPIKNFLIHGLIFDTFFTIRFMIANIYYFLMVRILFFKKSSLKFKEILNYAGADLSLFQDYESLTRSFFVKHKDAKVLIVGHTHEPIYREYADGTSFINTGTWTKMLNLDLNLTQTSEKLTFALIEKEGDKLSSSLNIWHPKNELPYYEF